MKNNKGVLSRPSARLTREEKKETKRPIFLTGLLTILLIVSYIFTLKSYEPVANVIVTGGILTYPLTFLVIAYIIKYYSFKEARKSVYVSAGLFTIFILLIMLCLLPHSNTPTMTYNSVIQYLFANDYFTVGKLTIFYPMLGLFFGILIAFVISHLLYSTIYNAVYRYTSDYLAMGLSVLISAIMDRIIFMPILFAKNLINGSNTFDYFIKCLTSEFMMTIGAIVILLIIYVIIVTIKKKYNEKKSAKLNA